MQPASVNFTMKQGATFDDSMVFTDTNNVPVDLTGWSAKMQLRLNRFDPDPPILTLSTDDGTIALGNQGLVQFQLQGSVTAALNFTRVAYDLFLYGPNNGEPAACIAEGYITLNPAVTR